MINADENMPYFSQSVFSHQGHFPLPLPLNFGLFLFTTYSPRSHTLLFPQTYQLLHIISSFSPLTSRLYSAADHPTSFFLPKQYQGHFYSPSESKEKGCAYQWTKWVSTSTNNWLFWLTLTIFWLKCLKGAFPNFQKPFKSTNPTFKWHYMLLKVPKYFKKWHYRIQMLPKII